MHRRYQGRFHEMIPRTNLLDDDLSTLPEFEPFDPSEATPRATGGSPLSVLDLDLCKSQNAAAHKTWMYNTDSVVLRRGAPFTLKITFNRPITNQDYFQIQFRIGSSPNVVRGSLVTLSFSGLTCSGPWACRVEPGQAGALSMVLTTTANAIVGQYRVVVGVGLANGLQYTPQNKYQLYLLFNAFSKLDEVYLEAQSDSQEYVLNDSGVIYMGDPNTVTEHTWNYGQFEAGILEACILIMDLSQMPIADRGDPIKVVRMASAMINSQDDNGVLVGNWSNDFSMGVAPTLWTGSAPILQQYTSTRVPVSYAQCWVYAGVMNTFLRCLGLASRVITNFLSAHDNNGNLKTDLIFNTDLTLDTRNTRDSIWNYHCWNEVFMKRKDIPERYSGWQVVDATPQETSDGNYRCGPASVKAIKEGSVCYQFDSKFIFAEVNSDVVYYKRDKYGNLTQYKVDRNMTGKKILTKSPTGNSYMDITLDYKYAEDSEEEAEAKAKALSLAESYGVTRDHTQLPDPAIGITISTGKTFFVGETVEAQVDFVNRSQKQVQAQILVLVEAMYYTGVPAHQVHQEDSSLVLPAGQTRQMVIRVPNQDYILHLGSQPSLQFTISAKTDQNQSQTQTRVVSLEVLKLNLNVSSPVVVGQKASVDVSVRNDLSVPINHPRLALEGSGLVDMRVQDFGTLQPGATLQWTQQFSPTRPGSKVLTATMICDQLFMFRGSVDVNVQSAAPDWFPAVPRQPPFGNPPIRG